MSQEPDIFGPQAKAGRVAGAGRALLCVGDSITKGVVLHKDSYPQHLDAMLREAGQELFVVNAGVWGDTCQKMLDRLPRAVYTGLTVGTLVCVLVMGGTNDIMGGSTAQFILANLRRLHLAASAAPGAPTVGVLTIPPAAKYSEAQERVRQQVNEALRADCAAGWAGAAAVRGRRVLVDTASVSGDLCKDGVHYFGDGHQEFAKLVFQALNEHGVLQ